MTTLAEQMNDDVEDVLLNLEEHAKTIVFRPAGGPAVPDLPAIVEIAEQAEIVMDGTPPARTAVYRASVDFASRLAPIVKAGDGVDVRGKLWRITKASYDGYGLWSTTVERSEVVDRVGEGYYAPRYVEDG